MNLEFSDDDRLIQDQVSKYLTDNCPIAEVRSVLDGYKTYAEDVWRGLAEMGLMGINVPAEYGGVETGYKSLCLVAQAIGSHAAPIPFSSSVYLVTEALVQFGNEQQKSHWLPKLASGEVIGALALTERLEQVSASNLSCSASNGTLNGSKLAVADGGLADIAIVLAAGVNGAGMYLVELNGEGVVRETVSTIDPSRNTVSLNFDNCSADLLGVEGEGFEQLQTVYDRAAVLLAFEQIGGAQAALNMAVEYARERYAFGRPIGSFQALKHMMADMYTALRLAESNCFAAATALASLSDDLPLAAATARVSAIKAFQLCAKDTIQVHGGMGFTWEFDCHIYYRRSNYQALELGGLSVWEGRLVDMVKAHGLSSSNATHEDPDEQTKAFREDELIELASVKKRMGSRSTIAETSLARAKVAQAEAALGSARLYYYDNLNHAWSAAQSGKKVTLEARRDMRLAITHAVLACVKVVDDMYALGGGASVYRSSKLQRYFRDIHVATQHILVGPGTLDTIGGLLLGSEVDVSML